MKEAFIGRCLNLHTHAELFGGDELGSHLPLLMKRFFFFLLEICHIISRSCVCSTELSSQGTLILCPTLACTQEVSLFFVSPPWRNSGNVADFLRTAKG